MSSKSVSHAPVDILDGRHAGFDQLDGFDGAGKIKPIQNNTGNIEINPNGFLADCLAQTVRDFDGFWEFVSGPLNAGSFGPSTMDGTFGPQLVFAKTPPAGRVNLSPYAGLQFFGEVNIAAQSEEMTVDLRDINGVSVFSRTFQPRVMRRTISP